MKLIQTKRIKKLIKRFEIHFFENKLNSNDEINKPWILLFINLKTM
jgi:hypothetical protein